MSISLGNQIDSVFDHGLEVIQTYKQSVLKEWSDIQSHLQKTGGKSAENIEKTIDLLTDYFFNPHHDTPNLIQTNTVSLTTPATSAASSFQINQIMVSLLRNSTHKVLQDANNNSHQDHQAIQFMFDKISETVLENPLQQHSINLFLHNLISSNQLPIEWAAIVVKTDAILTVEKWFDGSSEEVPPSNYFWSADTIFALSEQLLDRIAPESKKHYTVIPIPHEDMTLLFCIDSQNSHVIPFVTHALQIFKNGKDTLNNIHQKQRWKDSVILFNEWIMTSNTYQEAVESITSGFAKYLPFQRCALFSLSRDNQIGFGLYGQQFDNEAIRNISEDINNLPIVQKNLEFLKLFGQNLNYLRPIYLKDASIAFPKQYIQQFELGSAVIVPIFTASNNKILGAAILDQGARTYFNLEEETFSALIRFGQSAGEILSKFFTKQKEPAIQTDAVHLSPRETDVLKLLAEGASTHKAADHLHLSEYTVRDYVSAIMLKMEAQNRTEAVARAIREGVI